MLDFFRQKGLTSIVYGVIIVGMILVFVVGFNPSAGKKLGSVSEACAARVRGSCIEPKAHRAAYRLIFAHGSPGMKQQTASRMVLEGLIERELLAGEADRLGLTVGEDEITDSIFRGNIYASLPSDNPMIGRQLGFDNGRTQADRLAPNGFKNKDTKQFDMKIYERTVKQLSGRSPTEFREWQARELLAAKMRDLIKAPVRVADDEGFDRYVVERTTSTVSFTMVRNSWIEKYAIATDQKDIDAWSKDKANLGKIVVPVRHILIKGGEKPEEKAAAKTKAQGVLDRVKKGEDFAKLAKEFSDDPGSKDKGGQYAGEMVENFVEPFKKSVQGLKPGELDQNLVETNFGWHIIKRDEATKDDIAKAYKSSKSGEVAKAMAKDILADISGGKPGEQAAKDAIAKYGKFTPPKPKEEKKEEKKDKDAGTAAATGDGGATAAGEAGAPPAQPTYTAADDPERPQFISSSAFNRGGDPIPAISGEASQAVVKFAFEAKPTEVVKEPIRTDDGWLVIQLKDRKPATKEDFDKERDQYMAGLLAAKQAEALAYYVRRLRESSKQDIKIDEQHLFGAKQGDAGGAPRDEDEE
jgi:peptidyl-prolyl cis-trans isomerase D